MKSTTIALSTAIASILFAGAVSAADPLPVPAPLSVVPQMYKDGLTRLQAPDLTVAERAAFSAYEGILQLAEVAVQVYGCVNVNGTVDAFTDMTGAGDVKVATTGATLEVLVNKGASDKFRGDKYVVKGSTGKLGPLPYSNLLGEYTYNKTGGIMGGNAILSVLNPTIPSASPDTFTATVIKDFYLTEALIKDESREVIYDWGLQLVNKKGYPQSKWFQVSQEWRENGVEAKTKFWKTRIAGGTPCTIKITTSGNNNPEYFYQKGSITIAPMVGINPLQ